MINTVAETERLLDEVRYCFYLLPFEPTALRPSAKLEKTFDGFADQLASLNKEVYFSAQFMPDAVERLNALSLRIKTDDAQSGILPEEQAGSAEEAENEGADTIDKHLAHMEALLAGGKA
ncbi:hypothetical protein M8994_16490 [Brucella sp. 21LCYQ03]|nr:hypothetical protein [Brucella sp. 21LCYQ03]